MNWDMRRVVQFETYQENSQLLDPYLHGIVDPLATSLRHANPFHSQNVKVGPNQGRDDTFGRVSSVEKRIASIGKFLWVIASVR